MGRAGGAGWRGGGWSGGGPRGQKNAMEEKTGGGGAGVGSGDARSAMHLTFPSGLSICRFSKNTFLSPLFFFLSLSSKFRVPKGKEGGGGGGTLSFDVSTNPTPRFGRTWRARKTCYLN